MPFSFSFLFFFLSSFFFLFVFFFSFFLFLFFLLIFFFCNHQHYHREITAILHQGYTKSVDLWSLGCVTVVILTGAPPFRDPESYSFSASQARQGDLEHLQADPDWVTVGQRPKDFVYRLLVLDETQRMDAKAALEHAWFTNPTHRAGFDAVYKRAVRDWRPRALQEPVVLKIERTSAVRQACRVLPEVQSGKSDQTTLRPATSESLLSPHLQRRPSPSPILSIGESETSEGSSIDESTRLRLASPTLSDPDFPREEEDNRVCIQEETSVRIQEDNSVEENRICILKQNKGGRELNNPEKGHDVKSSLRSNTTYPDNARVLTPARYQSTRNSSRPRPSPNLRLRRPFSPQAWSWTWNRNRVRNSSGDNSSNRVVTHQGHLPDGAQQKTVYKHHLDRRTIIKGSVTKAETMKVTMANIKQGGLINQGDNGNSNDNDSDNDSSTRITLARKRPLDEVYALEGEVAQKGAEETDEEEEDGEDEVYEEVENPLSGERYRVLYGTRIAAEVKKIKLEKGKEKECDE
ncbi:hypothetical protein VTN77DRAFT_2933 [Rasamsonia byssochlamydoides]|uniref:uncharacterized protein n=1 Tax=Rasamsonia byssochlamydoides TaxID=89139 RepID=UPI003743A7A1